MRFLKGYKMSNSGADVSNLMNIWNEQAQTYDHRLGGATNLIAKYIVSIAPPINAESLVLDNCCGTGAVTSELIVQKADAVPFIYAIDKSPAMMTITRSLIAKSGLGERILSEVMDSEELKFTDNSIDLSITNFGIFFCADPVRGAQEIYRTLKPGGTAFVTCWKYLAYKPILYLVQDIIQPEKRMVMQMIEDWSHKEKLQETMSKGGFSTLKMMSKDIVVVRRDMEELMENLVLHLEDLVRGQWSENEKSQIAKVTSKVVNDQRETFIIDLGDGKVGLPMCAWIVEATK